VRINNQTEAYAEVLAFLTRAVVDVSFAAGASFVTLDENHALKVVVFHLFHH
jgi:hypothetical protein